MIVVLDANTLASMAVARLGGTLGTILALWRQARFEVVLSRHVLDELTRALDDPYFSRRLSASDVSRYLDFVRSATRVIPLTVLVQGVATHPEDDLVLSTALSGQADYLVTGDNQLLKLGSYQTVLILSPRDFLAVMG